MIQWPYANWTWIYASVWGSVSLARWILASGMVILACFGLLLLLNLGGLSSRIEARNRRRLAEGREFPQRVVETTAEARLLGAVLVVFCGAAAIASFVA